MNFDDLDLGDVWLKRRQAFLEHNEHFRRWLYRRQTVRLVKRRLRLQALRSPPTQYHTVRPTTVREDRPGAYTPQLSSDTYDASITIQGLRSQS